MNNLWPLVSGLLLAALCLRPLSNNPAVNHFSDFCSHDLYLSFIVVAAVLLLWKRMFWWPLAVSLGCFLCVEGLKVATRLPRPNHQRDGFPSGHTTFSFALAWLLLQVYPKLAPLWFAVAVSIGWSRVEGQAHYPYQVLCGAVLGTLIGWCISQRIGMKTKQPCR